MEQECSQLGISFHLLTGPASSSLVQFVKEHQVGAVVTDFGPLRVPRQWLQDVINAMPKDVSICQVGFCSCTQQKDVVDTVGTQMQNSKRIV